MTRLPDIGKMLPSAARRALVEFFLDRFVEVGVNERGRSMYDYAKALGDIRDAGDYVSSMAFECWGLAQLEFDRRFPLRWDNSEQKKAYRAYREGLSRP